jgi:hypothetical protein
MTRSISIDFDREPANIMRGAPERKAFDLYVG